MPKSLTIVVYKPDSQSTDEYMVYVNFAEVGVSVPPPRTTVSLSNLDLTFFCVWLFFC
jgi:hypothetical protein